jgi:hypothetical protein
VLAQGPRTTGDPVRGARRSLLLDAALAPLADELPMHEIERLKTALSMMVGVEAMVVLRDVLRLDHAQAKAAGELGVTRNGSSRAPPTRRKAHRARGRCVPLLSTPPILAAPPAFALVTLDRST